MGYRVLFITFWYPSKENPVDGIFIREHAKALINEGHKLVILHFDIKPGKSIFSLKHEMDSEGVSTPVYRIKIRSKYYKWISHNIPFLYLLSDKEFRKIRKNNFNPQIIHANVIFPSGLIGSYLGKRNNVPVVLTEHWSGFESFCKHRLFGRSTRKAVHHFKCIMPVSKYLGDIIRKYTIENQQITVVPNVVDSSVYTLKTIPFENDTISFLAVANWQSRKVPAKRPDLMIEGLALYASNSSRKVMLRIVGDGNLIDHMKSECELRNLECEFLGFQGKNALNELFHQTDFFIHASNFETFSIVTVEALMTGTPVIVSDLPALRELVNQENGVLTENTIEKWAEAIENAVNMKWDPNAIAASVNAKYNFKTIGQKITEVYNNVLFIQ